MRLHSSLLAVCIYGLLQLTFVKSLKRSQPDVPKYWQNDRCDEPHEPRNSGGRLDPLERRIITKDPLHHDFLPTEIFARTLMSEQVDGQIRTLEKWTQGFKDAVGHAESIKGPPHRDILKMQYGLKFGASVHTMFKNEEIRALKETEELRAEGRIDEADRYKRAIEEKMSWWVKMRNSFETPTKKYITHKEARKGEGYAGLKKGFLGKRCVDNKISSHNLFRRVWSDD